VTATIAVSLVVYVFFLTNKARTGSTAPASKRAVVIAATGAMPVAAARLPPRR
jgi:vacuolar-type H+-ATPase catalytic subunit A/Vma1